MDRLEAMTAFVAVADLQGFAAAARRLRVSPSAVTRLVAALETHLGARLLQRTTRSVALTDAGARYLERARRILADVAEAEELAEAERAVPTGRLVVSAPNVFGRVHVAPALCGFLLRHRALTGELMLSDRFTNLVEEGVDVAVRIGALDDSSLVARAVGATRTVLVASPKYLASHPKLRAPADLARHDAIQFSSLSPSPEWRLVTAGREVSLRYTPRFVTSSADAAIGHAELGGGITAALAYQVVEAVRARRLAVVLASHEPPPLPIHLVFPSQRLLSAKVRAFVEWITSSCDWRFVEL